MRSYLPVAGAMKMVQKKEYESIACGGFSGGCDMLLRAIAFTSVCLSLIHTFMLEEADIHSLSMEELRKNVGLVFQTPALFPFSIYKNLT